ncbi:hypothetical protein CGZ75_06940 [Paenibacillus herberti]|uniref:Copper amine oxidase-like N-terminal domain-containing protein n=2 Tax=Paenibacillus herberti TaxID=1619309 RepID=A0A229P379_9BACL|nr:hypothetical protein CGZ75_06940 [Paenibacillus herberti]
MAVCLLLSIPANGASSKASAAEAKAGGIRLIFNGSEYKTKAAAFIDKGVAFLPLRDVGGLLGSIVKWDINSKTVLMSYPELLVKLSADSMEAAVNDKTIRLSSPLRNVNGTLFAPLRFFAEVTGASVQWDSLTNTATMKRLDDYDDMLERQGAWLNRITAQQQNNSTNKSEL